MYVQTEVPKQDSCVILEKKLKISKTLQATKFVQFVLQFESLPVRFPTSKRILAKLM